MNECIHTADCPHCLRENWQNARHRIAQLEAALRDIRQAIWIDKHGIKRIDVGCIEEALESVFGSSVENEVAK